LTYENELEYEGDGDNNNYGATGSMSRSFQDYLDGVSIKRASVELQKMAVL
jgi:hypothetical protein